MSKYNVIDKNCPGLYSIVLIYIFLWRVKPPHCVSLKNRD